MVGVKGIYIRVMRMFLCDTDKNGGSTVPPNGRVYIMTSFPARLRSSPPYSSLCFMGLHIGQNTLLDNSNTLEQMLVSEANVWPK